MSGKRYSDEFKVEAAKQVIDQGRSVREVSTRLGVSIDSLYAWVREQRKAPATRQVDASLAAENRRLQAELKRVTEERDILKKAAVSSTRQCNIGYMRHPYGIAIGCACARQANLCTRERRYQ